jgi:hypothetical protein
MLILSYSPNNEARVVLEVKLVNHNLAANVYTERRKSKEYFIYFVKSIILYFKKTGTQLPCVPVMCHISY